MLTTPETIVAPPFRLARFRWVICGLLFFLTSNVYLDKQVFGIMAPELIKIFGWSPAQYTEVVFCFQVAYGLGFLLAGRILDYIGTRVGIAFAICVWSIAAGLHGVVGGLVGFKIVRFILGLHEPSHLPGSLKVVAEWFPRSERAFATGIYKSGANLGAVAVPLLVPWLFHALGWRSTFVITASSGFVLLALWLWLYRIPARSRHVSPLELAYIQSDPVPPPRPRVSWLRLLRCRHTWAYVNFKFMTDAMWHWYAAMFPLYLAQHFDLKLRQFGLPLIVVYLIADCGSISGGWFSSYLIKRGYTVTYARKLAMFVCCLATVPVMFVGVSQNLWLVIVLVGLAHAAHQGLTSNLFTTVSDLFPQSAVGTVAGMGGAAGQVGAALMTLLTGYLLATTGSFSALFMIAGSTYLIGWIIFHFMVPRLEPLDINV